MPKRKKAADLEEKVTTLEARLVELEKKLAEPKPKRQRREVPAKTPKKAVRVYRKKDDEPSQEDSIRMAKLVITDWKNQIYGSKPAKGGQHFMMRSLVPLTSNKHFRDLLETEAAWLAAAELRSDSSVYWNLQLFCKGNHNQPETQWKPPFEEIFPSKTEESEKEE